jgi:tRNA threonylcarbamoyladenosine biosynthesis protein TsaB
MVKLLALDTAAGACSVAIRHEGGVLQHRLAEMTHGHAEALMPMVREVMDAAGASFTDLDAIAVTVGPGAFTGIRIGLAAARGMALAARLPTLGVTTLEALAHAVPEEERAGRNVLALIDSRRRDLFAQLFDAGLSPEGEPEIIAPDALAARLAARPVVVAGDGVKLLRDALAGEDGAIAESTAAPWPDAAHVAAIAAARYSALGPEAAKAPPPAPLYLRPPEAKLPRHGGRLRQ